MNPSLNIDTDIILSSDSLILNILNENQNEVMVDLFVQIHNTLCSNFHYYIYLSHINNMADKNCKNIFLIFWSIFIEDTPFLLDKDNLTSIKCMAWCCVTIHCKHLFYN